MLSITMLWYFDEWHYTECRYAECRYAECHYAGCRSANETTNNSTQAFFPLNSEARYNTIKIRFS